MKNKEQIRAAKIEALAKLDGWNSLGKNAEMVESWIQIPLDIIPKLSWNEISRLRAFNLPNYLTSYNAIIPLIQKLKAESKLGFMDSLHKTPEQLCDALLAAHGIKIEE